MAARDCIEDGDVTKPRTNRDEVSPACEGQWGAAERNRTGTISPFNWEPPDNLNFS